VKDRQTGNLKGISGSGCAIHEKELDFDRGMLEKGKAAFPVGCDMSEKLRQLKSRRLYFMRMAGKAERKLNLYVLPRVEIGEKCSGAREQN
jgi:hypothetical protein